MAEREQIQRPRVPLVDSIGEWYFAIFARVRRVVRQRPLSPSLASVEDQLGSKTLEQRLGEIRRLSYGAMHGIIPALPVLAFTLYAIFFTTPTGYLTERPVATTIAFTSLALLAARGATSFMNRGVEYRIVRGLILAIDD